ncbi:MAG: hypothetical protein ACI8UX_002210 [Psychromonas sp.]|jgi:hypothetical protein
MISGVLLRPANPKAVVQRNSATAVPKEFYKHIAQYLAEIIAHAFILTTGELVNPHRMKD